MSSPVNDKRIVQQLIVRLYIHHIPKHRIDSDVERIQMDFILGFASEHYIDGKGDGRFNPTWEVDPSSIERVKKFKQGHPEVRVVISIGGVGTEFPFNPVENLVWIDNAAKSIQHIIELYDDDQSDQNIIDGIDIHYDVINSSHDDFSYCIGQVIRQLKLDKHLAFKMVVSIAPTQVVESYYHILYLNNKDIIDLVDYQFYSQKFSTKEEIIELYKKLVVNYTPALVLPGIPGDPILNETIKYLLEQNAIPGVFFWDSEDSINAPKTISLEHLLQNI
ncbi:unnamed protein product [Lathyrus oleraceus]|uniref:chitinase 1 n=1 Tax=Pisum sativum TaxID=3888 RepID=UPI001FC42477|nr:chitinase 1-like [Pisum sativum]